MKKTQTRYDIKRILLIKQLADEFGVTEGYVRLIINGKGKSENCAKISNRFNELRTILDQAIA
jgi:hypothetical protein